MFARTIFAQEKLAARPSSHPQGETEERDVTPPVARTEPAATVAGESNQRVNARAATSTTKRAVRRSQNSRRPLHEVSRQNGTYPEPKPCKFCHSSFDMGRCRA